MNTDKNRVLEQLFTEILFAEKKGKFVVIDFFSCGKFFFGKYFVFFDFVFAAEFPT
jgi:hypothetical protein